MGDKPNLAVSEEDRVALANKLDKELDEFIAGLEKKAYTDGWKEDEWQKVIARNQFLLTS